MEDVKKLKEAKKPLILHHWDTDGICSAAMIKRFLGVVPAKMLVPMTIGRYSLSGHPFQLIEEEGIDAVIVADLALPEDDFDRLIRTQAEIWVFDHHMQKRREDLHQFNPVARGSPSDDYPSTTWVLREFLETPMDLLTVLGAVGDKGERIRESAAYSSMGEYIDSIGVSFEELLRMCELIDSNHAIRSFAGVEDAVSFVLDHGDDPSALLTSEEWTRNAEKVRSEIAREEPARPHTKGILVHRFSSSYDIISAVSRRLSKKIGVRASVVIQEDYFPTDSRVYVRTNDLDLTPVLEMAKGGGHISGGKREVVGAIVHEWEVEAFVDEVLRLLEASN